MISTRYLQEATSTKRRGPFKILKKISSNAYVLELQSKMNISSTFNVEDLTIYHGHYQDESFEEQDLQPLMIPPSHEELNMSSIISQYQQGMVDFKSSSSNGKEDLSDTTSITATKFQQLNLDLYLRYQAINSPKLSFAKPGRVDESQTNRPHPKVYTQRPKSNKAKTCLQQHFSYFAYFLEDFLNFSNQ